MPPKTDIDRRGSHVRFVQKKAGRRYLVLLNLTDQGAKTVKEIPNQRDPSRSASPTANSFCLFTQSVTGVTDFSPLCLYQLTLVWPQEGNMTPKHKLGFVFTAVLVMAVFVAITTWAAVPKSHGVSAAHTKATVYRPDLWKVY